MKNIQMAWNITMFFLIYITGMCGWTKAEQNQGFKGQGVQSQGFRGYTSDPRGIHRGPKGRTRGLETPISEKLQNSGPISQARFSGPPNYGPETKVFGHYGPFMKQANSTQELTRPQSDSHRENRNLLSAQKIIRYPESNSRAIRDSGSVPWIISDIERDSWILGDSKSDQKAESDYSDLRDSKSDKRVLRDSGSDIKSSLKVRESFEPKFDVRIPSNLTLARGLTAQLKCRIFNLGNKTVSWLRQDSMHILSAGLYTYISNTRFLARYSEIEDTWILSIREVVLEDSGVYECQVSSLPVISFFVTLNIVERNRPVKRKEVYPADSPNILPTDTSQVPQEPRASILGKDDIFLETGSILNITCVIHHLPDDLTVIRWLHQDRILNYNTPGKQVSVFTNKGDTSSSTLIVQNLVKSDSGKYMCAPDDIQPVTIYVHVLEGEVSSQLHTSGGSGLLVPILSLVFTAGVLTTIIIIRTVYTIRSRNLTIPE